MIGTLAMVQESNRSRKYAEFGEVLREAREKQGYSQKAVATALGAEYYSIISQYEKGYTKPAASHWKEYINILGLPRSRTTVEWLYEIFPEVYEALFDNRSIAEVGDFLELMRKGQLDALLAPDKPSPLD